MDKSFNLYLQELLEWNKKFNLTAITDPEDIKLKHFTDSLTLEQVVPLDNQTIVDVGTGGGFPGLPLKIKYPNLKLTLIEATRKKTEFLKHIIEVYKLEGVEVIWGRAEEVAKEKRNHYDLAVARAVAKLDKLTQYCLPLVKPGGLFVAYKGQEVEAEVKAAEQTIRQFNGTVNKIVKIKLTGSDISRSLVIIKKSI
ncbi:MAG: 16S rRNA (guanine(527)-N(7))-methyltransferase RsmG [bacterium]